MKPIIILVMALFSITLKAQDSSRIYKGKVKVTTTPENEKPVDDKRTNFFTGGSISLGLSSYGFNAGLHPHFGYTLTKWIDVAAVTNFEYNSQRDIYDNKYHNTTLGIGAFTRIYPVRFAFIQVQPEVNYVSQKFLQNGGPSIKTSYTVPSLLLGIGYTPSRSDKNTFSYFTLMFDVLKNINSPYVDGNGKAVPIIRAGYNIGLFRGKKRFN